MMSPFHFLPFPIGASSMVTCVYPHQGCGLLCYVHHLDHLTNINSNLACIIFLPLLHSTLLSTGSWAGGGSLFLESGFFETFYPGPSP